MQLLVLGPLRVTVHDRHVELARGHQRAVLAVLALAGGETVSTDRLVDAVWDGSPPDNAVATLHVHVSKLRAALRSAGAEEVVVTRSPGYALKDGAAVDAVSFERVAAEGRAALRAGRLAEAATLLADALDRWRGPVLSDIDADFVRPHRARLDELRRVALEDRVDTDLALGRHNEVASWLPAVARELPHQERLHGQLVLALHRAGRQADALHVCHELRRSLAEDLGLEPSPQIRALEHAVLEHDASLAWSTPTPPVGAELVGRHRELAAISAEIVVPGVVTLHGAGGVGKTRLAIEVAHAAPVVELGSIDAGVLSAIARTAGVSEETARPLPEALAAALPSLVVIDNCEHVLEEVELVVAELVELATATTFLLTSRTPLTLPGERTIEIAPLPEADAVELFLSRARPLRPAISASPAIVAICDVLGGLPLAIELAAARTDLLEPEQVAARLNDSLAMLTRGSAAAPSRHRTLRAALEWGHDLLDGDERILFRRLAVLPGSWSLDDAEVVVGASALDTLAGLVRASLVAVERGDGGTRFRMTVPIRQLAAERLLASGESDQIHRRLLEAMLATTGSAYDAIRGALAWAVEQGGDVIGGHDLCVRLTEHWFVTGALSEGLRWCDAVLVAAKGQVDLAPLHLGAGNLRQAAGDLAGARGHFNAATASQDASVLARAHFGLANLAHVTGEPDALDRLRACSELARVVGDDDLLMRCANGLCVASRRAGDFDGARLAGEEALRSARRLGDRIATVASLINLGNLLQVVGRVDEARVRLEEGLAIAREERFARGMAGALGSLAALETDPTEARACFAESLEIARASGDRPVMAATMANLAVLHAREGDVASAQVTFEEYRALSEQMGDPRGVAFAAQGLAELASRADDAASTQRLVLEALALRVALADEDRLVECLELAGLAFAGSDVSAIALASADARRTGTGIGRDPDAAIVWDRAIAAVQRSLAPERLAAAWTSGSALSPADAAHLVLSPH